jgi:crotonobetainyl-CoA:carnitine CoA-transferase CaiB-like acyl-CoA transferase
MGREELSDDLRFEDNAARCRNMALLDDIVESWTSSLTRDAVVEAAQSEGVPCAPVRDIEEVLNDPHLHARGMLKRIDHPLLGEMVLGGSPLRIEGREISNPGVNPELGADNERVYGEMLHLSKADVEMLKAQGVI